MANTRSAIKNNKTTPAKGKGKTYRRTNDKRKTKKVITKKEKTEMGAMSFSEYNISNALMIDGHQEDGENVDSNAFWEEWKPRLGHVYSRCAKLAGNKKVWVYLQHELYHNPVTNTVEPVPVVVVIVCEIVPTLTIVKADLQTNTEDIESFDQNRLRWEPIRSSQIYVLVSDGGVPPRAVMNICKPSSVACAKPVLVTSVEVTFTVPESTAATTNPTTFIWNPLDEQMSDYMKEDDDINELDAVGDKEVVKALLLEKHDQLIQEALEKVQNLKTSFDEMMEVIRDSSKTDADQVRKNLEAMKVYKIFPSGLPVPEPSIFGPTGGFRYELKVNRVWGNADKYFLEWDELSKRIVDRRSRDSFEAIVNINDDSQDYDEDGTIYM